MPIYAYKCESCGFAKDVLQKLSDAPLSQCPSCNAPAFKKQVTAAGFQLKGSGWYATDFKGGNTATPPPSEDKSSGGGDAKADTKPAGGSDTAKSDAPAKKADASPPAAGS